MLNKGLISQLQMLMVLLNAIVIAAFYAPTAFAQTDGASAWELNPPHKGMLPKHYSVEQHLQVIEPLIQNRPDSALQLLTDLEDQKGASPDFQQHKSKIYAFIAVCNLRKGNYAASEMYLDTAFKIAKQSNDREMLSYLHNVNAMVYQQSGAYSKSIDHYIRALEQIKYGLSDKRAQQTYINFGGFWSTIGEHKQALKYYNLADSLLLKHKQMDPYVIMNIGIAKADSSNSFAIDKFKEALQVLRSGNDWHITHKLYVNLASAYRIGKQLDSAYYYLNKAFSVTQLLNTDVAKTIYFSESGQLFFEDNKLEAAETALNEGLFYAKRSGLRLLEQEAHQTLAQLYEKRRDFENAFTHQQLAIALQDSLDKSEKYKTLDLMLDYQRSEQSRLLSNRELELSQRASQIKQRNAWIIFILTTAAGLIALVLFAYWNSKNKQKLQKNELILLMQQQELEKIKAIADGEEKERNRIAHELHDSVMVEFASVKMQLNALPAAFPELMRSNEHAQLIQQMDRASKELRLTAHNLMPDLLLDEGIVQATFYFCNNIEKLSGLAVSFQYIGAPLPRFHVDFELLIYRVVQELIQNIIKHSAASKVLVQISYDEEYLSITIEDNGKGFDQNHPNEGIGLRSIKNRLQMFNSTIDIKSVIGMGTTVYIECPSKDLILGK